MSEQNKDMMFGITIPRTVGVTAFLSTLGTVAYFIYIGAGISNKIDTTAYQINQVNQDLQKLKTEIVTRSELAAQMNMHQRESDRLKDEVREIKADLDSLEREVRDIIKSNKDNR